MLRARYSRSASLRARPGRKAIRAPLRFALVTSPGNYSRSAARSSPPGKLFALLFALVTSVLEKLLALRFASHSFFPFTEPPSYDFVILHYLAATLEFEAVARSPASL